MELQEFISDVLRSVLDARDDVDECAKKHKLFIVYGKKIDFNIELTVIENKQGKAGIGVFASQIGIGVEGKTDNSTHSVGSVSFSYNLSEISTAHQGNT